jgi:hypothetical protein
MSPTDKRNEWKNSALSIKPRTEIVNSKMGLYKMQPIGIE